MIYVFDLDDTLYDELTYVKSGFLSVAEYLSMNFKVPEDEVFQLMWNTLKKQGRGNVFDIALENYGIRTQMNIKRCLSIYRGHSPHITLLPDANLALSNLSTNKIYIVTDGNKIVQHNKLVALDLYPRVKRCFITHRFGRRYSKPSPYCFHKISQIESCSPSDIVYIGDNPNKDFVGIKPFGFRTIQVLRGSYCNIRLSDEFHADAKVENLMDIFQIIEKWRVK